MNIELGKVEKYDEYTDKAFRRGKKRISQINLKNREATREEKYRTLESIRISVIKDSLINDLQKILTAMPHYANLDNFYKQIFACFVDVDKYKLALGSVKWLIKRIANSFREANNKVRNGNSQKEIVAARNMFLARSESLFKQIKDHLKYLDTARRQIIEIPNVKTSLPTIAIAGFPNVGKSTLLGKITDSKPEINSYAFTTKGLMIGYLRSEQKKIQTIDTPGTLNRFDKMNKIEKMAHLCLTELADAIVYVFDLTEPYPIEDQIALYENIKTLGKEVIIYFSKTDILDKDIISNFDKEGITDAKELKERLLSLKI